jgi:hypothetical protein
MSINRTPQGLSLVTFFRPVKKDTRLPAGTGDLAPTTGATNKGDDSNRPGFLFPAPQEYANLPALIIIFPMDDPWI